MCNVYVCISINTMNRKTSNNAWNTCLLTNSMSYTRAVHYMKYGIPDTEIKYKLVALKHVNQIA